MKPLIPCALLAALLFGSCSKSSSVSELRAPNTARTANNDPRPPSIPPAPMPADTLELDSLHHQPFL